MSKADKIKSIVKRPAAGETFGTNPSDPWSTKANIAEWAGNPAGLLGKYLKSRGINPKFATKDQKIAHSKTGQFQKWQKDHAERSSPTGTTIRSEEVDKKDTVTFDIPLLIRVLELAREDIKSDMDLHRVVERLINMREKGMLTMDDYDEIAAIKEEVMSSVPLEYIKEALEELNESDYGPRADKLLARSHSAFHAGDKETSSRAHKLFLKARDKHWSNPENNARAIKNMMSGATKDYKDQEAKRGIGHVRDHVEVDGSVVESKEANYGGDYQSTVLRVKELAKKKPVDMKSLAARMQAAYAKDKKEVKEDTFQDPKSASEMPFDGANNPNDVTPPEYKGKRLIQMSKSARIIKNLYKQKGMKEETYDFEKADKSVESYGKPPKVSKTDKSKTDSDKEQAAIVLSGGKTLTGDERDTIEIDPKMKMRPNQQPEPVKSGNPQVK